MNTNTVNNQIANSESAFAQVDDVYGMNVKSSPTPEKNIGIDLSSQFLQNVLDTHKSSSFSMSELETFTRVSQDRETVYELLDSMTEDSMVASVLEIYAEDSTETNDKGQIVWVESDDAEVNKYVSFLLDSINVDKNIYTWAYSLCKYGDLYLRLFHESDIDDGLFSERKRKDKESLKEDVILKAYKKSDNLVHYVEMAQNPAEIFELTKFGKTYAYIEAPVHSSMYKTQNSTMAGFNTYKYAFKRNDVYLYEPTEFVHACLEDNSSRVPEQVDIFLDAENPDNTPKFSYKVKRGQSLLYNSFKIWREMMLLENSMLLNRLTKSSIVRIVNVEVGDMPKEQIGPHLMGIKQLMEQKASINENVSLREYTNPGPVENNIYVPTRNGQGSISTQEIGGNLDIKGLADIDYFKNRLYSALRVPKQFLGDTDDGAGFNGGASLSIISSRYAKMIKRIQNTLCQAIADLINIMLLDKGLDSYINKFVIRMQEPTTQEEMDRRNNLSVKIQSASDILALAGDIENPLTRLKMLKNLIAPIVQDSDFITLIQDCIDELEAPEEEAVEDMPIEDGDNIPSPGPGGMHTAGPMGGAPTPPTPPSGGGEAPESTGETAPTEEVSGELPSPEDLGAGDFTNNNM